uniref:Uncharacterized protein n=1 Tax=Biomphalaria glabrata TaxID=6526 RepID=A0A2C9LBQ5_BIOGL
MSSYDAFFKARNKGDIVRLVSKSKIELFISFPDNITTFDCIFDKYSSSSMCTVLGIATHFLWLWMFSWSAICSYHMLRVFTASTRSSIRQKNMARHLKRLAISLVCPTIMVAFTLLYSYMTSHGETLGYGRYSCYLNTTLLI